MDFKAVISSLKDDLKKVDEIILQFSHGKSPLIQEISNHLIASGGKRIRPILLILSSKIFNENSPHNLAAAVELIHTATLLHDDVVDVSEVRRGKKTANALWDNKSSILVGDFLFSISFQLMVKSNNLEILNLLAKTSSIMADGEVMQLENSNDVALTKEKYLEIIFAKTAALFSSACKAGALFQGASKEEAESLKEFGKNLGMIFQIVDDLLDYSSKEKVLGKDVGNDFFEGKVTLPIILTYQAADEKDKELIRDIFEKNLIATEKNQSDLKVILSLLEKYHGFSLSKEMALNYKMEALKNLEIFPDSNSKQALTTVLDYSLARLF